MGRDCDDFIKYNESDWPISLSWFYCVPVLAIFGLRRFSISSLLLAVCNYFFNLLKSGELRYPRLVGDPEKYCLFREEPLELVKDDSLLSITGCITESTYFNILFFCAGQRVFDVDLLPEGGDLTLIFLRLTRRFAFFTLSRSG